MLGFASAKWRGALFGLAGMVGFGGGGAIAAVLGMPVFGIGWEPSALLVLLYVLSRSMVGLIGGALLGAALGYLESRKLAEEQRLQFR